MEVKSDQEDEEDEDEEDEEEDDGGDADAGAGKGDEYMGEDFDLESENFKEGYFRLLYLFLPGLWLLIK